MFRRLALFCAGACVLPLPLLLNAQEQSGVPLDVAKAMAIQALESGKAPFAIRIAKGLAEADPKDVDPHFILMSGYAQLGQKAKARKSAARAYRLSEPGAERLKAAELSAGLALTQNRPTLSQFWLRRAAVHAEDDASKALIAKDYARVRAVNPFSFRIRGGITPSNNINGGSDSAINTIDGVPGIAGINSTAAQRISGLVGTFDAEFGWRVQQNDTSQTQLGLRFYTRQVDIDDDAKKEDPTISSRDFGATLTEVSARRDLVLGGPGKYLSLGAFAGRAWFADEQNFDFLRGTIARTVPLSEATRLTIDGSIERRIDAQHDPLDQTRHQVGVNLRHRLGNGDRMGVSLSLLNVDSDHVNVRRNSATARLTYAFGEKIGPVKLSTALTYGYNDVADYTTGGGLLSPPGGRQDKSLHADLTMFFPDYDYAGFAPSVRFRAGRTNSNVSRFESRSFSVSFEIKSKF